MTESTIPVAKTLKTKAASTEGSWEDEPKKTKESEAVEDPVTYEQAEAILAENPHAVAVKFDGGTLHRSGYVSKD